MTQVSTRNPSLNTFQSQAGSKRVFAFGGLKQIIIRMERKERQMMVKYTYMGINLRNVLV